MGFPNSAWPTVGSGRLWELLSLQMLLVMLVGPTFNAAASRESCGPAP